jgi:hypothetical protein
MAKEEDRKAGLSVATHLHAAVDHCTVSLKTLKRLYSSLQLATVVKMKTSKERAVYSLDRSPARS